MVLKIKKVIAVLDNGQLRSFEGGGTLRLVETETKQDDKSLKPVTYVELSLEVKK